MSEMWTTAVAGAAAGLGVAMPVGAMGVLLVQESLRDRRNAVAAAAAVAVVDLVYAALATAVGPLVAAALTGVEAWVRVVSATVLMVIAVRGLCASRHTAGDDSSAVVEKGAAATGVAATGGSGRTFVRFAALTLVNPTTALYFAALTTAQGAELSSGAAGTVFVTGAFVASLAWQQLLVAVSGIAGARIGARARAWTFRVGFGLVAVYAVRLALPLP
ncbi:LysE family transporter [Streptomyces sp. NPDC019396]|uniref:LysE family transporter n=1 Tax=Streptomyces sp. NPDC019396 TaxID=3154687 RepID=UPI00340FF057